MTAPRQTHDSGVANPFSVPTPSSELAPDGHSVLALYAAGTRNNTPVHRLTTDVHPRSQSRLASDRDLHPDNAAFDPVSPVAGRPGRAVRFQVTCVKRTNIIFERRSGEETRAQN
jgi:hypothetical protein